jgi:hypothetical protein
VASFSFRWYNFPGRQLIDKQYYETPTNDNEQKHTLKYIYFLIKSSEHMTWNKAREVGEPYIGYEIAVY